MNELKVFDSPQFGSIRTVIQNDEPWFVAADVCNLFGETNRNRAMQALEADEKGYTQIDTPGGRQQMSIVNEAGLYTLLFAMQPQKARGVSDEYVEQRQEQLKAFKRWITHDVIPSIRKHGAYMTPQKLEEVLLSPDTLIQLATNLKVEQEKNKRLMAHIEETKPKVLFAESVECSDTEILIRDLAKLLKQNGVDTGEKRLYEQLRMDGYLIRSETSDRNRPTQRSMDMGLMRMKECSITRSDGHTMVKITPTVTGKGQVYFLNRYAKQAAV